MEQLTFDLNMTAGRMVKGLSVPEGSKRCPGRNRTPHVLPLTKEYWYKNRSSVSNDGFQICCKECCQEYSQLQARDPVLRVPRDRSILRYEDILAKSITDGWRKDKGAIADRDNHHCYLCDEHIFRGTGGFDHIIPLRVSYDDRSSNVRYVHNGCNSSKKGKTLQELVADGTLDVGVFERVKLESE